MNAWVSGIGYSSLALASLMGMRGHGNQLSAVAPVQRVADDIPVVPEPGAPQSNAALLGLAFLSHGTPDSSGNLQQIYEDIEIYRRLLSKSLAPFASGKQRSTLGDQTTFLRLVTPTVVTNEQPIERLLNQGKGDSRSERLLGIDTNPHANIEFHSLRVDGAFLPQGGIVFTADVPGKLNLPAAKKPETQKPQVSEWDQMRRELRGEKVETAVTTARLEQPHVADAVLHSLAENGHHLSGLTADQNVAVVLTFRGDWTQQCQKCHTNITATLNDSFNGAERLNTAFNVAFSHYGSPNHLTNNLANVPLGQPTPPTGEERLSPNVPGQNPSQAQPPGHSYGSAPGDQVILGDLHFKQGRFAEAVSAYSKSLEQVSANSVKELDTFPSLSTSQLRVLVLKLIELQNRIIQCEAAMKHEDKVEQGVAKLSRWMSRLEQIEKNAKKSKSSDAEKSKTNTPPLPAKLIVVASKGLLDRVGKHQITFEDFKTQARVEYLKFDSSEK